MSTPGNCGDYWQVEFNGSSLHQNLIALAQRCIFDDDSEGSFFSACEVNGPYLNEGRDDDDKEDYEDRRRLLHSDGDSDGEDGGNKYNPYQLCLFGDIKVDLPGNYLDNSECPYASDRIHNFTQTMMSVCGIEEFRGATCDLLLDAGNSSDTCRRTIIEFFSLSEGLNGDKAYCGGMAPASDGSRNHTYFYRHLSIASLLKRDTLLMTLSVHVKGWNWTLSSASSTSFLCGTTVRRSWPTSSASVRVKTSVRILRDFPQKA